jgi:hypothetical protein
LLTVVAFFIFIASTTYVWLAPPFSPDARLKVFFAQKVELTNVTSTVSRPQLTRAFTQLTVIEDYGPRLVATLPSSWTSAENSEDRQCMANKLRPRLTTCEWPVPRALRPSIPSAGEGTWLVANVSRLGPVSLRVEIEGVQTRACVIHVDNHGIRRYRARARPEGDSGTDIGATSAPTTWTTFEVPAEKEVHLLTLWARAWSSKFQVELEVDPDKDGEGKGDGEQKIAGRVSCMWNDGPGGAEVPSLEEARGFLTEWVAISKAAAGLVEATSGFLV